MKKNYFKPFNQAAIGLTNIGLHTTVGTAISSKAPAGSPSITGEYATLASFGGIATTATAGKTVLDIVRPKKKYRRY